MSDKPLAGKVGIVFGVANKRSIAWAIAQAWANAGATLIFNYQGERVKEDVEELAAVMSHPMKKWTDSFRLFVRKRIVLICCCILWPLRIAIA